MSETVLGQLILDDRVVPGAITVDDGTITNVDLIANAPADAPYVAPGFVDVHVHGWGGHSAMGDAAELDGMSRALLRHGVTSFLPTAVTSPINRLSEFADQVRAWAPTAPEDGAQPLGFNLEGPFLAPTKHGAQNPDFLQVPAEVGRDRLFPLLESLRLITIAPELPGALELIAWLAEHGVAVSVGHSAATFEEARSGYSAGAKSTTHLFNAMTGVDHRAPGVAVAALLRRRLHRADR